MRVARCVSLVVGIVPGRARDALGRHILAMQDLIRDAERDFVNDVPDWTELWRQWDTGEFVSKGRAGAVPMPHHLCPG